MSLTVRWALSGLAGIVCLLSTSPDLRWVGLLLFLWPGESLLLFLNARLDFNRAGILRVASAVLYLLGAVALFMAFHDPRVAALARGLSFFLTGALVAWRVLRPRHFRGWRLRELLGYLRGATGFFALSVSSAIFGHIDVLLLAWLMSREDVGLYRPLFTLAIVPTLLSTVVRVPLNAIVSSGAWTERRALLAAVHTITGAIALISLSLLAALYALAPWLIELVLGPAYLPGVAVFRVVLLASVLQSFVTPYYSFLAMKGSLALLVALGLTSTLGLVLLDLLLIPGHGTLGAAWARTGVQILGLLMILVYFYGPFLRRLLPPEPDRREP